MRMLQNNLLVEKLTKEQLGKIVMPESVQDEWQRGRVLAVGPDIKGDIKIDDIIIFPPVTPYGGPYPVIGNEGYVIVPETYIWAVDD